MSLINRRDFIKLSACSFIAFCSHLRLPVYSANKYFKPFKFAFVPCAHLSNRKFDNWILLNESLVILQESLRQINQSDVDFVVFGGDTIDNQNKDLGELSTFLDLTCSLEKPYYVIFGEREARLNNSLSKEDFAVEFRRYGFDQKGRTYWSHNPVEGVDLIGLDSTIINKMQGEISPSQLVWLSSRLGQNSRNLKIILVHHPLLPDRDLNSFYTYNGFKLQNSDAVIDLFERTNKPELVLSAHHHVNLITSKNRINYVNSPSIVTYPCQYRVFEITPEYIDIQNISIPFKQMIKKAKNTLVKSQYATKFPGLKPKQVLKLHKGEKSSIDKKIKI